MMGILCLVKGFVGLYIFGMEEMWSCEKGFVGPYGGFGVVPCIRVFCVWSYEGICHVCRTTHMILWDHVYECGLMNIDFG